METQHARSLDKELDDAIDQLALCIQLQERFVVEFVLFHVDHCSMLYKSAVMSLGQHFACIMSVHSCVFVFCVFHLLTVEAPRVSFFFQ